MKSQDPRHFLVDSKGDMYEVSKEIADAYALVHSRATATVDHVNPKTKTIYFSTPLPKEVKADA